MKVIVYTKENCPQCVMTKNILKSHDMEFEEIKLNSKIIEELKEELNGIAAAPVIKILINGHLKDYWTGFRPEKIKAWKEEFDKEE